MSVCPTCGASRSGKRPYWTRERIIEAIQRWDAENGRAPRIIEWQRSGPWWPHESTVRSVFGKWNDALREAM